MESTRWGGRDIEKCINARRHTVQNCPWRFIYLIRILSTFWVQNIKKNNYHYVSVVKIKKRNSEGIFWSTFSEFTWKNYNNSARIAALSSKDILNELRDLGVNIKFIILQVNVCNQTSFTTTTQICLNSPIQQVIQPIQENFQDNRLKHTFVHRLL